MKTTMKAAVSVMTAIVTAGLQFASAIPASAGGLTAGELFEKYSCLYLVGDSQYGWTIQNMDGRASEKINEDARRTGIIPENSAETEYFMQNEYRYKKWTLPDSAPADALKIQTTHYINCEFEDGFYYAIREDGTAVIAGGDAAYLREKCPEKMVIPETIGGAVVTEIAKHAFYCWLDFKGGWTELQEVVIPDTVEIVGEYAFQGIFGREEYGSRPKLGCKINIPANLREVHFCAFANLGNAFGDVIELPETLEYLQDRAFEETACDLRHRDADGNAVTESIRLKMPKSLVLTDYAVPRKETRIDPESLERGGYQRQFEAVYLNGECNIVCLNDALSYYLEKENVESPALAEEVLWAANLYDEMVWMLGDVNANGEVDVADAVLLARFCAEDSEAVLSGQGCLNADVNNDGKVDAADSNALLMLLAKTSPLVPMET